MSYKNPIFEQYVSSRRAKRSTKIAWFAVTAGLAVSVAQQFTITTIAGGAPPATPVTAANTSIGPPRRVAADASGNVYFSAANSVFKMNANGILTLVAGNSRPGYSGDGGGAINAQLNAPKGVALDGSGNIYISDTGNHCVRIVAPNGVISTFAGNGTPGYSGDGGPANQAQLHNPGGLAFNKSGNLLIVDTVNNAIRQVASGGAISTIVGNGFAAYIGDEAVATSAQLALPEDITVDSTGNIYIVDTGNYAVRKITSDGNINTIAGRGRSKDNGDGGQATGAVLNVPFGIAVDSAGNVYISQYSDSRIRQVSPKGVISTYAGTGTAGFAGDGSASATAQLANPWGLGIDGSGNLFVADTGNNRVRKISSNGASIATVAGNGLLSYSGDGGAALKAQLNGPEAVAVDASGNLYISDSRNARVRKVGTDGRITAFAGNGSAGTGGDGGPATSAQITEPAGVAVDSVGNVYVADAQNNRVRKISLSGTITTVAGTGGSSSSGDGGPAVNASLGGPAGIAVDAADNLYIAEVTGNKIRKVSAAGTISTVAGNGGIAYSGDGGPATQAQVKSPKSVAVDAAGNVFIADTGNHVIREVTRDGMIATIAGTGVPGNDGDGSVATRTQLAAPSAVAVDASGNVYLVDAGTKVRRISVDGSMATIAGNGATGYSGDGGDATRAQINGPSGLGLDKSGSLYIADTGNSVIRLLQLAGYNAAITGVTNSASSASGPIASGEIVILYGSGLGPSDLAQAPPNGSGSFDTNLSGTRILFNGTPAPIVYTSSTQVAAIVPDSTSGSTAQVVAQYLDQTSAPVSVQVASAAPGLFTADYSGTGQALALNADGSANGPGGSTKAGDMITVFATGLGMAPAITAVVGGQAAQATATASGKPGVFQVVIQIPSGTAAGAAVSLTIVDGGISSQAGVTVSIGN